MAYTVLKVCGAVYMSWLGLQLLIRPRSSFSDGDDNNVSQWSWFIKGMLGNVLNPEMGIFYVSFLPHKKSFINEFVMHDIASNFIYTS